MECVWVMECGARWLLLAFSRSKSIIRILYIFSLVLALVEAKEKYAEWRTAQENKAEQDLQKMSKKPAPYKHIKVVISANCQL